MAKKCLVTLNIGNYAPEIRALTMPLIKYYAKKCDFDLIEITERKFPEYQVKNIEKFQCYEIAQNYERTLFVDLDAAICPDFFDFWSQVDDNCVVFWGRDFSPTRFKPNIYTERDARWIGACTWFVGCSYKTYDLWTPPQNYDEDVKNINPICKEIASGCCTREHLIDDYTLTLNMAKYGLKYFNMHHFIMNSELHKQQQWAVHTYMCSNEDKVKLITEQMEKWGVKNGVT